MIQNPQGPVANVVTIEEIGVCEFLKLNWEEEMLTTDLGETQLAKKVIIIDNPGAILYQSTKNNQNQLNFVTPYYSGWFTFKLLGFNTFNQSTINNIIAGSETINACQIIYYVNDFYTAEIQNPTNPPIDSSANLNVGWRVSTYDDFIKSIGLLQAETIQGIWGTIEYLSLCHSWRCMNRKVIEEQCDKDCGEFCRLKDYEKIHHKLLATTIAFNNHQFAKASKFIDQIKELCGTQSDCGC